MSKLESSGVGSPLPTTTGPGRELDALIAEKLFDYEWRVSGSSGRRCVYPKGMHPQWMSRLADKTEPLVLDWDAEHVRWTPAFSTDIAAAWLVVEKMRVEGRMVSLNWLPEAKVWNVRIYPADYSSIGDDIDSESAPHAICLAALAALENAQARLSPDPDTPT